MAASSKALEALLKAQRFQAGAWQKVIDVARQYAQMKTHGSYVENGGVISVCFSDRKKYEEMFSRNLLHAAETAFLEDALLGSAVQNTHEET